MVRGNEMCENEEQNADEERESNTVETRHKERRTKFARDSSS